MFWKSICRKIPVLESLWSLQACNFSRNRLWHRCYPGKFAKFLTTTISNNICERLLLDQYSYKRESSSVFTRKSKSTRKLELHKSIHTEFKNNFWTNITLSVVQSKNNSVCVFAICNYSYLKISCISVYLVWRMINGWHAEVFVYIFNSLSVNPTKWVKHT